MLGKQAKGCYAYDTKHSTNQGEKDDPFPFGQRQFYQAKHIKNSWWSSLVVTAVAQVQSLAQELPHAAGTAKKKKKVFDFTSKKKSKMKQ